MGNKRKQGEANWEKKIKGKQGMLGGEEKKGYKSNGFSWGIPMMSEKVHQLCQKYRSCFGKVAYLVELVLSCGLVFSSPNVYLCSLFYVHFVLSQI